MFLLLSLAAACLPAGGALGQAAVARRAAPDSARQEAPAGELKVLTLADYGRWSSINQVALSPDGRWMTFAYEPNEGDSRLFLRDLDDPGAEPIQLATRGSGPVFSENGRWLAYRVSAAGGGRGGAGVGRGGRPAGGGGGAGGGGQTLHLVDLSVPGLAEALGGGGGEGEARARGGERARGGGSGGPAQERGGRVESSARREFEHVTGFSFSKDSRWLAIQKAGAAGAAGAGGSAARGGRTPGGGGGAVGQGGAGAVAVRGTDLLLLDLDEGSLTNFGHVAEYAFNDSSTYLAYLVDAEGRSGNGLFAVELPGGGRGGASGAAAGAGVPGDGGAAGAHRGSVAGGAGGAEAGNSTGAPARILPLNTGDFLYQGLAWNEDGTALAVLRGDTVQGMEHRENVLVTVSGLEPSRTNGGMGSRSSNTAPRTFVYDPSSDPAFPEGFVISEFRSPTWSEDGRRVFVGIKEQMEKAPERGPDDEPHADVVVWHWKDKRVQSQQEVQAGRDRRATFLSVVNLEGPRFLRLATEDMERVQLTDNGRWAVGFDDSRYWMDRDHEANRDDVYRIDPVTGEKTLVAEALINEMGLSPDSRWFLFWQDKRVQAFNLESGETVDLTARAGPVDFENKEFDRPVEKPAYGVGGWSTDGRWVFLYTKYDIWRVALDREESWNVTFGRGEAERVRFRVLDLDREDEGIDLSEPVLLSAYGEWTKKSGYFRARPDGGPEPLLWDDAMFGTAGFRGAGILKAKNADRVLFTRQTFEEFPDYWVSDMEFHSPRKVTEANPQQAEYRWGSRRLIDYTDERGHHLQAALTLPAGYEEGRRYPMIIYFYEKMSQRLHEYSRPVYDDRPHMSTYASDGYLVLMPDIVYDMGYPGSSALDDVSSAAKAAIEQGYADPDRICLQGHSWGGYETSFILTQTDMFACVVTGAPLTNLVSMHNILYKQSGSPNASLIQWGQGRMDATPYEDLERYVSQSPVHHVQNITTPFLILQGTADGAVDWNQGLEYYIAARRMGKEVIFLSYPDEPHHLSRKENQKDFQIRMKQFFDHYLKDAPAPLWMSEGVPYLKRDRIGPEVMGKGG